MGYQNITIPDGDKITVSENHQLTVPSYPIIPYIEGDGIGVDVTPVMKRVVDAAVDKAYDGNRAIAWMEVFAGEKALSIYGDDQWLPTETLEALKAFVVSIKGPLTTPVGGGIRSLNVAIRQELDLYVCQRPVRWFNGVPSPLVNPQDIDMVVYRENSEDIYAGIEWQAGSQEADKVIQFLKDEMGVDQIRFDQQCGVGIKPVSKQGTQRLIRKALEYCIANDRSSLTLVHKGNIMKYTEGAFKEWGYALARNEFGAKESADGGEIYIVNPRNQRKIIIKDVIADAMLQQILLRPSEYDVIATLNLNGDYISDALAAEVGGIGIAPGANISDDIAVFEATHGSAPKYAGLNKANPGSMILSAEMMLRHMGWVEAAEIIIKGVNGAIAAKRVTYDFERLMEGATCLSSSEFGDEIIQRM